MFDCLFLLSRYLLVIWSDTPTNLYLFSYQNEDENIEDEEENDDIKCITKYLWKKRKITLISIDGSIGSGKTTLMKYVKEYYKTTDKPPGFCPYVLEHIVNA